MLSIRVIVARFYFVKNIFHIFDVTINWPIGLSRAF